MIYRTHGVALIKGLEESQQRLAKQLASNSNMSYYIANRSLEVIKLHSDAETRMTESFQVLERSIGHGEAKVNTIFSEISEKLGLIIYLQSLVTEQFFDFGTFIFYLVCFAVVFFLTAFEATTNARVPLLLLSCGNYLLERNLRRDGLDSKSWVAYISCPQACDSSTLLDLINKERALFAIICSIMLIYKIYTRKDVLEEITKTNGKLNKVLTAIRQAR